MAKDWRTAHRCPVTPKGNVKSDKGKSGTCFSIERVKRNGTKGFVTTLHNRATGRRSGYSATGQYGKACPITQDPFKADVRSKGDAISAGAACSRKLSVAKKVKAKKRKVTRKAKKTKRKVARKGARKSRRR